MRARIIDRTLYLVDKETYLIIYVIMLFREIDFVHFFQRKPLLEMRDMKRQKVVTGQKEPIISS